MSDEDPGRTHFYGDGCDPPHVPTDDEPMTDEEWEPFARATGIEPLSESRSDRLDRDTALAIGAMVDAYRARKMTAAETMRAIRAYISDWERDV